MEIWSDIVCPWCYVGKRRFERALAMLPNRAAVQVIHRAYLLYGSLPRGASVDRRDMLMSKYRLTQAQADAMNANMVKVAAADGLDYHLAGGMTGNTFDAHQVVQLARVHGRQDAVLEHLYDAFFAQQRSIFDHTSLTTIASEAGLNAEEVERTLRENLQAPAVENDLQDALAIGVTGVPFFVFDRRIALAGAQAAEVFSRVFAGLAA